MTCCTTWQPGQEAATRNHQEAMKPPLASRLQTATAAANRAAQAKSKAQKACDAAKEAWEKAAEELRASAEVEADAAAPLQRISSEVGQDKRPQQTQPPRNRHCETPWQHWLKH